jgi:ubiquinone biosynthesis protein
VGRSLNETDAALELRRALALLVAMLRFAVSVFAQRLVPGRDLASVGVQLRVTLERLGLTYLKLGQYLAMRFDILPPEICRELGKLFDDVAPMPAAEARAVIERELGAPVDELFEEFVAEPLAAASVAQVHEARTHSGERVVVKVQRPGIERTFRADIRNLRRLTRLLDAFHALGQLSATEMLDQFASWTIRETDFVKEGETAERVGLNPAPYEVEPAVHWDLTTSKVLTLDFVEGTTLAQLVRINDESGRAGLAARVPGLDLGAVLHHLTFASLRQIFAVGLFHGDPHPGNILVLEDNRIAFVDFGIFGELTAYDRGILGKMIEELAVGNVNQALRAYTKQLTPTRDTDVAGFRADASAVLTDWYELSLNGDSPVASRHLGKYVGQMIEISRRYRLVYDMSFLLYWRALQALDSTALRLDPEFDLMGELRSFFATIRPGFAERLSGAVLDGRRLAVAGSVLDRASGAVAGAARAAAEGRLGATIAAGERPRLRRARHRQARWLTAALAGLSLLIASGASGLGGAVDVALVAAGCALATISAWKLAPS